MTPNPSVNTDVPSAGLRPRRGRWLAWFVRHLSPAMSRIWSAVVLIGLVSTAVGASTLPVPPGATKVDSRELYGGRHKQDAYLLSVPFPDDRAISHYRTVLKAWRECPSRAAAWESFGDLSVE